MDQGPLVIEEIDAGAELVRGFENYVPIKVAFWVKASDEDQRYLYLASDGIDANKIHVAYGELLRIASKMQSPYLDPFRVKLIKSEDPLAKAALEINQRFPGRMGTRYGGKTFGGASVDDVYVYPSPLPVPVQ